jgi:hypothetical protein
MLACCYSQKTKNAFKKKRPRTLIPTWKRKMHIWDSNSCASQFRHSYRRLRKNRSPNMRHLIFLPLRVFPLFLNLSTCIWHLKRHFCPCGLKWWSLFGSLSLVTPASACWSLTGHASCSLVVLVAPAWACWPLAGVGAANPRADAARAGRLVWPSLGPARPGQGHPAWQHLGQARLGRRWAQPRRRQSSRSRRTARFVSIGARVEEDQADVPSS